MQASTWFVIVSIVVVWVVLFGGAWLLRTALGWGSGRSAAVLTGLYAGLGALALCWFGLGWNGFLGVFGMALPYAAALAAVVLLPARQHGRGDASSVNHSAHAGGR